MGHYPICRRTSLDILYAVAGLYLAHQWVAACLAKPSQPRSAPNIPHYQSINEMNSIAEIQDEKEREILKKYQSTNQTQDGRQLQHQESAAARVLQRTYRGHKERRQLRGLSLDPSTRWTEVRICPTPSCPLFYSLGSTTLTYFSKGSERSSIPRPHHPPPTLLQTPSQSEWQRPQPHRIRSPSKLVACQQNRPSSGGRRRILPFILALRP